ncbi:MAG: hypothetical protein A2663_04730 [Candidatus Buchananbacteria bacterium RIFCSPHIGHO2_01_FULL_46_12]|uniref:Uncharacterized protein n=1 Tax=Candidatus Buchananbacteria bacterium RIFCSPHIGHO2_01_FULL_46_12 TaxID=1797536 RepID=A0A1G1Y9S2_9BACT|nr:MAG: hypothetical protein A2663_04730 [Candidatus Buchananbacteria bacterium RIFCSPHIGHO2_01_FULL_46_12]
MEKTRFINLIDQLSTAATLNEWEAVYDRESDNFCWQKPKLSQNVRLVKVSHDISLFLTPAKKVEGLFVEYLKDNFTKHNIEYKGMTGYFDKKVADNQYTISRKTKDLERYFDKFAETLKADIYRDAIKEKKCVSDLDFTISTAFAN